jgi:hypothetical protein
MINLAGWGFWVWIVMSMMFIGPVMRMIFGGRTSYWMGGEWQGGKNKARIKKNDVARLEAAIDERDTVIEDLQNRLSELESRLDFTERLLSGNPGIRESGYRETIVP